MTFSAAIEPSNHPIAQAHGEVTYTVTLVVGNKAVPAGSKLAVATSTGDSIIGNICSTPNGTMGDITINAALPQLQRLDANLVLSCQFKIRVTTLHKQNGQIDPVGVTAEFTYTGNDAAFHIPVATSEAVPVYTGGMLTGLAVAPAPVEDKFYNSEILGLKISHACHALYQPVQANWFTTPQPPGRHHSPMSNCFLAVSHGHWQVLLSNESALNIFISIACVHMWLR